MTEPRITVNGEPRALRCARATPPRSTGCAATGLTGAKEGCAEGECGACAVLVARAGRRRHRTQWTAVNACLVPAAGARRPGGRHRRGPRHARTTLHPVQREMAVRGGSQCGYCTPGFVCSMAAEFYRPDRRPRRRHGDADADHEHGPNGFDLHALSGNLCRCTGYRPIRDAAYALGAAARRTTRWPPGADAAAAGAGRRPASTADGGVRPARDLAEALALLAEHPDAVARRRLHRLGRRGQPPRRAGGAASSAIDRLPELRELDVGDDYDRDRRRPHPHRGRARPGRPGAAARRAVPAVRLPADPQRRHASAATSAPPRRSATRRRRCSPSTPTVVLASRRRRPRGAAGRLLHRLPPDRAAAGRADPRGPDPAAAGPAHRVPQDRQAPLRRHLQRRGRRSRSTSIDGVVRRARIGLGGVAATPIRALGDRGGAGGPAVDRARRSRRPPACSAGEGTPMDDHRASAAYRAAMLGQALLQALRRDASRSGGAGMSSLVRAARRRRRRASRCRTRAPALHVTGAALYTDDLVGRTPDVLHAWPVQAPHAHARVTGLRPEPAYDVAGRGPGADRRRRARRQRRRRQARRAAVPRPR